MEIPSIREHYRRKEHAAGSGVPGKVVTGGEGCEMTTEKSLLTRIREKELEVSVKIDDIRVESDRMIEKARKDAQTIITTSEAEGKKAAEDFLKREMKQIQAEAEHISTHAGGEVDSLRKKGEKNISNAVEKIVGIVLSG